MRNHLICVALKLAGGSSPSEGKLFATNPSTKSFGPVCDDNFADNLNGVSLKKKLRIAGHEICLKLDGKLNPQLLLGLQKPE